MVDSPASYSGSSTSTSSRRKPTTFTITDELSVEEHGRTFAAYRENKYFLPNDSEEQDRLDLQHKMWLLLLKGQLALAPFGNGGARDRDGDGADGDNSNNDNDNDNNKSEKEEEDKEGGLDPGDVLDIGTGTGIWAKQFARAHPGSRVVGTDLSLIQSSENTPPNCVFVREDSEEGWGHDHPFDYIHWRLMCSCFNNIKGMFTRVYENLRPGGWAEFQDAVFEPVGEDAAADAFVRASAYARYFEGLVAGGRAHGRDFRAPARFREWMVEAGFVGVVKRTILVPLNAWPLDPEDQAVGRWFATNLLRFLGGSAKLLEAGGMPRGEIPGFLDRVRGDLTDVRMRGYTEHYVYYGRKPGGPDTATPPRPPTTSSNNNNNNNDDDDDSSTAPTTVAADDAPSKQIKISPLPESAP